jgi:hypothetical protein
MTGLKGGDDFNLGFTRELPPNIPEGAQFNGAPIDRQEGPVPIMTIDHAEKPVDGN